MRTQSTINHLHLGLNSLYTEIIEKEKTNKQTIKNFTSSQHSLILLQWLHIKTRAGSGIKPLLSRGGLSQLTLHVITGELGRLRKADWWRNFTASTTKSLGQKWKVVATSHIQRRASHRTECLHYTADVIKASCHIASRNQKNSVK